MNEEFNEKYRKYCENFDLMLYYMRVDFDNYLYYANQNEKLYKELQEMQKKMKEEQS